MEQKKIILIVIAILVIALAGIGLYVLSNGPNKDLKNITDSSNNTTDNNTTNITVEKNNNTNTTNKTNKTVGDNSPRKNISGKNVTYKVYNPQSDSYVPVIGEKYDKEVNRWYTYDKDGVRYYNTRIN